MYYQITYTPSNKIPSLNKNYGSVTEDRNAFIFLISQKPTQLESIAIIAMDPNSKVSPSAKIKALLESTLLESLKTKVSQKDFTFKEINRSEFFKKLPLCIDSLWGLDHLLLMPTQFNLEMRETLSFVRGTSKVDTLDLQVIKREIESNPLSDIVVINYGDSDIQNELLNTVIQKWIKMGRAYSKDYFEHDDFHRDGPSLRELSTDKRVINTCMGKTYVYQVRYADYMIRGEDRFLKSVLRPVQNMSRFFPVVLMIIGSIEPVKAKKLADVFNATLITDPKGGKECRRTRF